MPIKKIDGRFCVMDQAGKKGECFDDMEAAREHMASMMANNSSKAKKLEAIMLEGVGPALIAVAATNKPHLRQRGGDITIVEKDGKKLVRVPVARRGIYTHPRGDIVFNDKTFERMAQNFNNKVTDYNVHLDLRHKDTEGALAWLDPDDGGFMQVEDSWLVVYGPPTDDEAERLISSKRYRFSSAEFHPNYSSNLKHKLSTDELEEVPVDSIQLYNSIHDALGRFGSKVGGAAGGGAGFSERRKKASTIYTNASKVLVGANIGDMVGGLAGGLISMPFALAATTLTGNPAVGLAVAAISMGVGGLAGAIVGGYKGYKFEGEEDDAQLVMASLLLAYLDKLLSAPKKGDYIGIVASENDPDLSQLGFDKRDGQWVMERTQAVSLQGALRHFTGKTNLEVNMKVVLGNITLEGDGEFILSADDAAKVSAFIAGLQTELDAAKPKPAPEIPAELKVRLESLEAENKRLQRERLHDKVALVLEKGRQPDSEGRIHDPVLLGFVEAGLTLEGYDKDGLTIKLEGENDFTAFAKYHRDIYLAILDKAPRHIQANPKTPADDVRPGDGADEFGGVKKEDLEKAAADIWKL